MSENVDYRKILEEIPSEHELQEQMNDIVHDGQPPLRDDERPSLDDIMGCGEKVDINDLVTTDDEVRVVLTRVYCTVCGKELISKMPPIWNPYTGEKVCLVNCECGFKANLSHTVPHLKYIDKDNNEINVFHE